MKVCNAPVSRNITWVSLNNAPVGLFTVSSQWWKRWHDAVKKVYSLHLTPECSLHYYPQSAFDPSPQSTFRSPHCYWFNTDIDCCIRKWPSLLDTMTTEKPFYTFSKLLCSPLDLLNGSWLPREGLHSYYFRQWENAGQRRHEGYFLRKPSCLLFPPGDNNVQNDRPRNFPSWRPTQSTNHLDVNKEKYSVKKTKKRKVKWPSYLNPLSTNRRRNTIQQLKKKSRRREKKD